MTVARATSGVGIFRARAEPASAIIHQGDRRWTFHPITAPERRGIPHYEVRL